MIYPTSHHLFSRYQVPFPRKCSYQDELYTDEKKIIIIITTSYEVENIADSIRDRYG